MPSVADAAVALTRVCGPKWTEVDDIIKQYQTFSTRYEKTLVILHLRYLAVATADVLNEGKLFVKLAAFLSAPFHSNPEPHQTLTFRHFHVPKLFSGLEFLENVLCPFLLNLQVKNTTGSMFILQIESTVLNLQVVATEREGEALCERLTDMLGGRSQESVRLSVISFITVFPY